MKIIAGHGVINPDDVRSNLQLDLPGEGPDLNLPDGIAYVPLINSHDHLVGNWVPKAGDKRPYLNSYLGGRHEAILQLPRTQSILAERRQL
jgi:hypothetical protein